MKKRVKVLHIILHVFLLLVFAISVLAPFVYWIMNPELTQMQVLIKFWWVFLIGISYAVLDIIIINRKQNHKLDKMKEAIEKLN